MNKLIKKYKKGFTLVELLVVIAILAVLASVSVVGYLGFTEKARVSDDNTELHQIGTLIQADLIDGSEDVFVADTSHDNHTSDSHSGCTAYYVNFKYDDGVVSATKKWLYTSSNANTLYDSNVLEAIKAIVATEDSSLINNVKSAAVKDGQLTITYSHHSTSNTCTWTLGKEKSGAEGSTADTEEISAEGAGTTDGGGE